MSHGEVRFYRLVFLCLIVCGLGLSGLGCSGIMDKLGMEPGKVEAQREAEKAITDKAVAATVSIGSEVVTVILAGLGVLATGLLGRLLAKEKKLTRTLIVGIEKSGDGKIKEVVRVQSIDDHNATTLAKKVKGLTGTL